MRRTIAALVVALSFALTALPANAEDPIVTDLRIDSPAVVTVGDRVNYTIVTEVDAGAGIALAGTGLPPEVALVAPPVTTRVPLDNGREQVTLTFQVAPFIAGEVFVPSIPLRFTRPDGSTGEVLTASSVIQVTSVLPGTGAVAPRDLKPQAEIGTAPPTWPVPVIAGAIAVITLLILVAIARRRFIKYRIARALRRQPVILSPEDIARAALDAAGARFNADGDHDAYYTALSNAVRNYLTARYDFPAFALTTRELEAEMARLGLDRWQMRVAGGLLSQCDTVVYARYRPAAERADADLTAAYEVVEMSRPQDDGAREEVAVS